MAFVKCYFSLTVVVNRYMYFIQSTVLYMYLLCIIRSTCNGF